MTDTEGAKPKTYDRVMLKISGEALMADQGYGSLLYTSRCV